MAAPTFVQEVETVWSTTADPKTTASVDVVADDLIVACCVAEGQGSPVFDITVTGGSLVWSERQVVSVLDYCTVVVATATVDTDKTMTVQFDRVDGGAGLMWGGGISVWSDANGVGASQQNNANGSAPTVNLTTQQEDSAVIVVAGDWSAADGTVREWLPVNGIVPSAGGGDELTYFRDAAHYVVYRAYYSNAGPFGAKTFGISVPGVQKFSIIALEVKGRILDGIGVEDIDETEFPKIVLRTPSTETTDAPEE